MEPVAHPVHQVPHVGEVGEEAVQVRLETLVDAKEDDESHVKVEQQKHVRVVHGVEARLELVRGQHAPERRELQHDGQARLHVGVVSAHLVRVRVRVRVRVSG